MTTREKVDGVGKRLLRWLLPPRCLLCGDAGSQGRDLCAGCRADMPANTACCARCALPLPIDATHCGGCVRRPPPFDAAWAAFRYAHPLDLLEMRFKFGGDLAAGRVLAELMIERAERDPPPLPQALLCVPLHAARLRRRGYNQALELARPLARRLGLPLWHDVLQRTRATSAQTGLDGAARRRNLRGALSLRSGRSLPPHVAVLDDVMTTGATLGECARVLRRAGVERVDVWALARAP